MVYVGTGSQEANSDGFSNNRLYGCLKVAQDLYYRLGFKINPTNLSELLCKAWDKKKIVRLHVWRHHLSENFSKSIEACLIGTGCL